LKSIKNKDITFYPVGELAAEMFETPVPAYTTIPNWFREIPKYGYGEKSFIFKNGEGNLTAKSCMPLVDGFTSGYMFVTPYDIQVIREEDGSTSFHWAFNLSGTHGIVNQRTVPREANMCPWDKDIFEGYDPLEFNWMPHWSVKTPKGYSCLFTHPINRIDLPFYTLGGVMDTDGWGDAGNQPFLLKRGWQGIIPAGTPFLQVIPFKREDWKSISKLDMIKEYRNKIAARNTYVRGFYKNKVWNSKNYR
jgi:hypothetical protein